MTTGSTEDVPPPKKFKEVKVVELPTDEASNAEKESSAFDMDGYEKESKRMAHKRGERSKNIIHKIVMIGVIIMAFLLFCGVVTWGWHILTPAHCHWLTKDQLYGMQKIMSSAVLAIIVNDYAKKYF